MTIRRATRDTPPRTPASAGFYIPPPVTFTTMLAISLLALHRSIPLPMLPGRWSLVVGALFTCAGLVAIPAVRRFRRARTSPFPWHSAHALVVDGPFRYTRNPMYVGFASLVVGIAGIANSLWPVVTLPLSLALIIPTAIRLEERYLEATFGEEYRAYCRRVRRWL